MACRRRLSSQPRPPSAPGCSRRLGRLALASSLPQLHSAAAAADAGAPAGGRGQVAPPPPAGQASAGGGGVLQLARLGAPGALREAWEQEVGPACRAEWAALRRDRPAAAGTAEVGRPADDAADAAAGAFLARLDALLGSLQQVLLLAGLLKDRHADQGWRAAAAAVFVEARCLEQEVCSDPVLQQALLLAGRQLHEQQQQQQQDSAAAGAAADGPDTAMANAAATAAAAAASGPQLAAALHKRMATDGLCPGGFAAGGSASTALSAEEQRTLLSALHAEQRALVSSAHALLLDPANAPAVELDAESRHVLLSCLAGEPDAGRPAAAAAAADPNGRDVGTGSGSNGGEAGGQLALGLDLASRLLARHPDAAVRQDVYAAGLLQPLDRVLQLWGDLAEARRKIGRAQGCSSYADAALRHTLLGGAAAALVFCERMAAALSPAASAAAARLQRGGELLGADLPYSAHQQALGLVDEADLEALQPYLHLPGALAGLDELLGALLGLSLRPRPAAPGEAWRRGVRVLELRCAGGGGGGGGGGCSGGPLVGTVYLDPSGGFSTQLLLYGPAYEGRLAGGLLGGGSGAAAPAVAVGLQSGGRLGGGLEQAAFGLWELCHEVGHAVHFLLSAAPEAGSESGGRRHRRRPFHAHAAWLPLEVLELPSTLFEALVSEPACLRVLCRHADTGRLLPGRLAAGLAALMARRHDDPLQQQRLALAALVDLQLLSIERRQLGRHAAHAMWEAVMSSPQLSSAPNVEVTPHQVSSLPRLLLSAGQGYGYAVAWCLAHLLRPALLRHARGSLAASAGEGAGAAARQEASARAVLMWRRLLSGGAELADEAALVALFVELQEHGSGSGGAGGAARVLDSLRAAGLWPPPPAGVSRRRGELLAVCLGASLRELRGET